MSKYEEGFSLPTFTLIHHILEQIFKDAKQVESILHTGRSTKETILSIGFITAIESLVRCSIHYFLLLHADDLWHWLFS